MPGTNRSQTPASPSERMGWLPLSQKLKSPATCTARALGAQTANDVPSTGPSGPSYVRTWAPSTSQSRSCRPSLMRCRSSSPTAAGQSYVVSSISLTFGHDPVDRRQRHGEPVRPVGVLVGDLVDGLVELEGSEQVGTVTGI